MLKIIITSNYLSEKKYIIHVIFGCFLGLSYQLVIDDKSENCIKVIGEKGHLYVPNVFFEDEKKWLQDSSMPLLPLYKINPKDVFSDYIGEAELPVLFGVKRTDKFIDIKPDSIFLGVDIFGSSFFMLSRYEEYVIKERDNLNRFSANLSIAYKEGFLNRPIVNEYVELLWCALKRMSPDIQRKIWAYRVIPTHDIDKPFGMMYDSTLQIMRHFIGDIIRRKSVNKIIERTKDLWQMCACHKEFILERKKTFSFIYAQSALYGLQDVFYFMNSKKSFYDGNYYIDEPDVLDLIKDIRKKGHKVGLHTSFDSFDDIGEIKKEAILMNDILAENGLAPLEGGRQHYLRWANPITWRGYEEAGIAIDSTLTYADHAGFRCGSCYSYPVYDIVERRILKLEERPLIVMDGTIYNYMKLSHKRALRYILKLAERCKRYNGEFVMLWHNTTLDDEKEKEFYATLLQKIC